jgi:hypothetical protein
VNASESVHVVLDIEHTDGTISGQLVVDCAHAARFHGWLELIDRIERLVDPARTRSAIHNEQPFRETR